MSMLYGEPTNGRNTYHHGDLYRSLLEAALDLIEADGLEGLSLRKMASRCKVSQTAPYRHFASKEHLLAVLAERGCEDLLFSMKESIQEEGSSLIDNITNLLVAYVNFAQAHCSYFQMIFNLRMLDRRHYPSLNKAMSKHRELLVGLFFKAEFLESQAQVLADHFWAYAHGMATLIINRQWMIEEGQTVETQIRAFVESVQLRPVVTD